jgi:repressor LexA
MIKQKLDRPEFWLLVRRFSMAPEGDEREQRKAAILDFIADTAADPAPAQACDKRPALTDRQREVFAFLFRYIRDNAMAPTHREIADGLGFRSANAAQDHLLALERKGYITLGHGRARAIRMRP